MGGGKEKKGTGKGKAGNASGTTPEAGAQGSVMDTTGVPVGTLILKRPRGRPTKAAKAAEAAALAAVASAAAVVKSSEPGQQEAVPTAAGGIGELDASGQTVVSNTTAVAPPVIPKKKVGRPRKVAQPAAISNPT